MRNPRTSRNGSISCDQGTANGYRLGYNPDWDHFYIADPAEDGLGVYLPATGTDDHGGFATLDAAFDAAMGLPHFSPN